MSTNLDSNQLTPQTQEITRREFLTQAAALPAVAILPNLPEVGTQEAPTFNTGLTALIAKLVAFDAYLQELANEPLPAGGPSRADAEALYMAYGEASQAAQKLDQLLISVEFEQTILAPLAGGIEQYHAALEIDPDEAIIPFEAPSPETIRQAYADMEAIIADLKATIG